MAHGVSDDDPPDVLEKKISQLTAWIRNAERFIVFTGLMIERWSI